MSTSISRLSTASLDELYDGARRRCSFGAGWNKPTPSLYPAPYKTFEPACGGTGTDTRPSTTAGRLVDTALAERRNLILINPVAGNDVRDVRDAGRRIPDAAPGRTRALASPHAQRAALDPRIGDAGAYTTVDGVRVTMVPNDVVLTPSWMWHGHGNEGAVPAYWIDYLDVPLVHALEPMFFEALSRRRFSRGTRAETVADALPRRDLEPQLRCGAAGRAGRFGRGVRRSTHRRCATIRLRCWRSTRTARRRRCERRRTTSTASSAGRGATTVDGVELDWERGDVFVAPAWRPHVASSRR